MKDAKASTPSAPTVHLTSGGTGSTISSSAAFVTTKRIVALLNNAAAADADARPTTRDLPGSGG